MIGSDRVPSRRQDQARARTALHHAASVRPRMFENRNLKFDLLAVLLAAVTAFLGASLYTYDPADPIADHVGPLALVYSPDVLIYPQNERIHNACGRWGALAADMLLTGTGVGAYYAVASLGLLEFDAASPPRSRSPDSTRHRLGLVAAGHHHAGNRAGS